MSSLKLLFQLVYCSVLYVFHLYINRNKIFVFSYLPLSQYCLYKVSPCWTYAVISHFYFYKHSAVNAYPLSYNRNCFSLFVCLFVYLFIYLYVCVQGVKMGVTVVITSRSHHITSRSVGNLVEMVFFFHVFFLSLPRIDLAQPAPLPS